MKRILLLLIAVLMLSSLHGEETHAQFYGSDATQGMFNGKDHDPTSLPGAVIHDIPEEATGVVMIKTKDQGEWGQNEKGEKAFRVLAEVIRNYMKPFLLLISMFMIVGAGIGLIIGRGGEEENWKQKIRETMWGAFGLFIVTAAIFAVDNVFFGAEGEFFGVEKGDGKFEEFGNRGYDEIFGIVEFMTSIVIAVGVALTIVSALQLIMAGENEEQITKLKKRITWGIVGSLVMFLSKEFVIEKYFFPDIRENPHQIAPPDFEKIIPDLIAWSGYALSFVALLGVVAILVAAMYMIAHFGDEERVTKAKNIIKWAVIGLLLAFSAWTLTYFFANPVNQLPPA